MAGLIITVPSSARVLFADAIPGATGRFNLVVNAPPGEDGPVLVRPGLSRYQATEAAEAINSTLAAWVDHGWLVYTDREVT